ncbi:hypothetical protein EVA23_03850 [bacterium]|nr:MAG: hypothetical protein EVA23_03850 [bacterium]|tara:strand:+ start:3509 stop:3994 length:486 start_codon:yes stop_codon:yes gene_type:complete
MRKTLVLIACISFFSCDQLLQRKQMYSVEITSCLFDDDDFNRSEFTGAPLPIRMELYEEGYLIWEVNLGKHRGAFRYDNSKVEDRIALIAYNPTFKYRIEVHDQAFISKEKGYSRTWAKGFPFKPSLERLSIGEHGSSVGFKSVTLKSMDYQPNKRLDEDK